ncbi:MAG: endonuclease III [Oscillospiraceae bacterium]|jgi:endonuclease-3|nr:endonuclease III [Oscillospiraceae bacterium]
MTKEEFTLKILLILKNEYPNSACALIYNSPIQLMIAARLSAQCTDIRVNAVTPALFQRFKTIYDFAECLPDELEEYIFPCGLYKTKAKDIIDMCQMVIKDFDGMVPDSIKELITLPGVGRKTANLILGEIYGKPAVIVDTHFIRITKRLGFHNIKDPLKIEITMKDLLPEKDSTGFCHMVVMHGKAICTAIDPKCSKCPLKEFCKYYKETEKSKLSERNTI